ncbi:protein adenylyltransferase SelO [Oceanisphaera pacifica]|uniref:Protein nucleotidyltransferase YdiU n=1 Tax=Oceanisphaera pacifica TaxID=2818389 RepID=A0ABS3NJZ0_9GAMM|nr:YdiU family protein [Oceanisphaera pacifica]MBO1520546.1 YdiU family protein [Oceanisphaera pacifica]
MRMDNQYAQFDWAGTLVTPAPLRSPRLLLLNRDLADELGMALSEAQWRDMTAGLQLVTGMQPFAQVYAGHQFGGFSPQLGDGRAMLLAEVIAPDNQRWDLHLKGAGKTPYSRFGDGRAVLRSSLREYLASEAMHHLGIATTRALALVGSQEPVYREQVESGAGLLRAAHSHLRFGHFEFFYYSGQPECIPTLLNYLIDTQWPDLTKDATGYASLFARVVEKTATLIAQWQLVGFCHGVLNTDNMSMLGLTLDYGPYGFLDAYNPDHICNHSDHTGRYAYDQQPAVGYWNLQRLAQALSGVIEMDALQQALGGYEQRLMTAYSEGMRQKLGLLQWQDEDPALFRDMFALMKAQQVDYTCWFRRLAELTPSAAIPTELLTLVNDVEAWQPWFVRYQARLAQENRTQADKAAQMNAVNPKYILRNHLAQQAIDQAEQGDMAEADTLLRLLANPFDEQPEFNAYAMPAPDWASDLEISCSS